MAQSVRIAAMCFLGTLALYPQAPAPVEADTPTVVKFVAPAYPRAAKDKRIMGKTTTRMSVARDGSVREVKTVIAASRFRELRSRSPEAVAVQA